MTTLELVDSMDPCSEGIIFKFNVMAPKESWKFISNQSGGDRVRHRLMVPT